jgi:hypothetical protein
MPLPSWNIRTSSILIAALALAFTGIRGWTFDPASSRLPVGSEAVLRPDEPGAAAVYLRPLTFGPWVLVQVGCRVTVLEDSQPSFVNPSPAMLSLGTTTGDLRDVKIRVLDGHRAGFTGYASRFELRPVR